MKPETRILTKSQIAEYLMKLQDWKALEVCEEKNAAGEPVIRIPYVMNDAVECYLEFSDCNIQGDWNAAKAGDSVCSLVDGGERTGLILRQDEDSVVTIWFQQASMVCHCWQYHNIGHRWRKKKGQETWRRIVNLLCVIHDKQDYLGDEACSLEELALIPLIEFAPITWYTPIDSSIEGWYPETDLGIWTARDLFLACDDPELARMTEAYHSAAGRSRQRYRRQITESLDQPEHQEVRTRILELLCQGSLRWPAREYSPEENRHQNEMRLDAEKTWLREGYSGAYPYFQKLRADGRGMSRVRLLEEQPFTVMEAEDYRFRIFAETEECRL